MNKEYLINELELTAIIHKVENKLRLLVKNNMYSDLNNFIRFLESLKQLYKNPDDLNLIEHIRISIQNYYMYNQQKNNILYINLNNYNNKELLNKLLNILDVDNIEEIRNENKIINEKLNKIEERLEKIERLTNLNNEIGIIGLNETNILREDTTIIKNNIEK
jgi:hypothetical protein